MDSVTQKCLAIGIQVGVPVHVVGDPGAGKTSVITQMGDRLGRDVFVFIPSIHEPTDLTGLPVFDNGRATYAPVDWAVELAESGKPGLLVFDEANTGTPAMQAAMLRVTLEGVVGSVKLTNVSRVLITNPPEVAPGGIEFSAPLANRLLHLNWKVDVDTWVAGMVGGWSVTCPVVPQTWGVTIQKWQSLVASFIDRNRARLLDVPNDDQGRSGPWPSPRSWMSAATVLAGCESVNEHKTDVAMKCITGCVGEAGLEFLKWVSALDLPSPQELLANPSGAKLPTRGDQLTACLLSLVGHVTSQGLTQSTWDATWTILVRGSATAAKDLAAVAGIALAKAGNGQFKMPANASVFSGLLKHTTLKA